ncbi:MAG: nickel pincer cofactor biosynthesis protein LarB [Chloroflexota bacterium]
MRTHSYLEQFANLDLDRATRTHIPEVVFAENKSPHQTVEITKRLLEKRRRAMLSRVPVETLTALETAFDADTINWKRYAEGRTLILHHSDSHIPLSGGIIGILSAGTSDIPIAEEAHALCQETGCVVHSSYDVGVAGLHRLFEPLQAMLSAPVDAIIVVAGMDGALPSVVAGLVDVPIIGLPTSVGYGFGGAGIGALTNMLQTCAPGLAVVNIDNGIGAGAMASRIAIRAAAARAEVPITND